MIGKGMALPKFLVLLALVLLAGHANAFISLSSVAGKQVRINHLTLLQQPISDPMNEQSRELIRKPTKQMNLDAVLPFNLSCIDNVVLSYHSNQRESLADQPGIDEKINHTIAASDSSQPTSHESSCASLLAARAKCLYQNESSCASLLAARAKCLNQKESSCASLLAACAKCLSHKSGCASLLARAKNLRNSSHNKLWWIVEYIFWNSSRDKFQLIVTSSNNDCFILTMTYQPQLIPPIFHVLFFWMVESYICLS